MDSSFATTNNIQSSGIAAPQNVYNLNAEYSRAVNDVPYRFTAGVVYDLPVGHGGRFSTGNRWSDEILGHWQVNVIPTFQAGFPVAIRQSSNPNSSIVGNTVQRPNRVGGKPLGTSGSLFDRLGGYINPAAFATSTALTFGDAPRTLSLRGPGEENWDISLFKNVVIRERVNAQFRAETFNTFNTPALLARVTPRTRALYLVNPHNPTATVNDDTAFKTFLTEASHHAVAIVDEAYLDYTPDFRTRTAANLTRQGANVVVFRTFDKIQGLAGLPIGYVLAPKPLAEALRKQGAGDAESLGRLNLAAAQAALADTTQVASTRDAVARERVLWLRTLDDLGLPHTESVANFIFFNAGRPQGRVARAMLSRGINIGRAHPPFINWARITIGLPEENRRAQAALREILAQPAPE